MKKMNPNLIRLNEPLHYHFQRTKNEVKVKKKDAASQ